ncbi:MAG: LPP20 family lipoprotein [Spirochaetales bacterium]|nr:LPP20 family lipoprotein [Spirochaetales bacterium]
MKTKLRRFLTLAAALLLAACGTTGSSGTGGPAVSGGGTPPAWMDTLETDYPDTRYLAAIGSGDTRRGAEDSASGALARRFNVNVKLDTVSQQRYAELVKADQTYSESEKTLTQTVGTQANEQFVNLRFSDPYTDNRGTTHVVAYIEREPTAAVYRSLLQKDLAKIDDFSRRASAMSGALQRYAFYDAAYSVGLNSERLIGQLQFIHPATARAFESQLDLKTIAAARDSEVGRLSYSVSITGDSDKRLEGILRKALGTMALVYHANGPLAVKGSWSVEPVELNPQFKSVNWLANISLFDESGAAIATYEKQSRENGISEVQARNLVYREVEKSLGQDFLRSIQGYLTRIVTGG